MYNQEQMTITAVLTEFWDDVSHQRHDYSRNRAQEVEGGDYHKHLHQHSLTFEVGAVRIQTNMLFI